MAREFLHLDELGQQYRRSAAAIDLRIMQLKYQLSKTASLELRRRLKHRIGALHVLAIETRNTSYHLTSYYAGKEHIC